MIRSLRRTFSPAPRAPHSVGRVVIPAAVACLSLLALAGSLALAPSGPPLAKSRADAPVSAALTRAVAGRPPARLHLPPTERLEQMAQVDGWSAEEFVAAARLRATGLEDSARISAMEEQAMASPAHEAQTETAPVLAIPVEFAEAGDLSYQVQTPDGSACVTVTHAFSGPIHGRIPYPGGGPQQTLDNETVYYPSTEPRDYERLIFGRTGYTEPVRAGDPNVNGGAGVDLSGLTVQSYFDAQSDGTVNITGSVGPWIPVPHPEAYYGLDICIPNVPPRAIPDEQLGSLADLAVSAAEGLKARGAPYDQHDFWASLDGDDDGFVDALWILHAGRGQDYGGGSEGEAAIWSRSSDIAAYPGYEGGHVIDDNGTADPADDIRLGPFIVMPEDSDIGVLIEEFGHSRFDFPDLYTTDASNSVGWWAPMSAGIWGGELGGTEPVNMPLFFRMIAACGDSPCGWADPVATVPFTTSPQTFILSQAGEPAGGTVTDGPYAGETIQEGLRVTLPDQMESVPNRAGDGPGAYSSNATGRDLTLRRQVQLPASDNLVLSFDAVWNIPRYWGYAYLEVSTDGTTFTSVPDLDGRFTDDNPYGLNEGFGLTGSGSGLMRFDVSAYADEAVTLRWRYFTYQGPPGSGWWIDNVAVTSDDGELLQESFDDGFTNWSSNGWALVPFTLTHPQSYLVEWRNANGFDRALGYATNTNYQDADEWRVDRVPANVPAAVVMYRNLRYPLSGVLDPQMDDPPSIGAKYGLLAVDANFWPTERASGAPFSGRLESLDGALALQDRPAFDLEIRDPHTGDLSGTETVPESSGVQQFDDALGYYPGFRAPLAGATPTWWDEDASVVVPSRDNATYSTRLTLPDRSRPHPLDGTSAGGPHYWGTGNPGDANLQYGVHIEVVDAAPDGSWGAVRVYNGRVDYDLMASTANVFPGSLVTLTARAQAFGTVTTPVTYSLTLPAGFEVVSGALTGYTSLTPGATEATLVVVRAPDGALPAATVAEATFDDGDHVWVRGVTLGGPLAVFLPRLLRP